MEHLWLVVLGTGAFALFALGFAGLFIYAYRVGDPTR